MPQQVHIFLLFFTLLFPMNLKGLLNTINVSGNPGALNINSAIAGSNPTSVTDASTTYAVTTILGGTLKITGQLSSALPAHVTLSLQLNAPPAGGTSQGMVTLSTVAADLVTNIPALISIGSGGTCTYRLSATVAAVPFASQNVTVTLTLL